MNGKVYLVGAGTGDEELLTLKALRLIKEADVVVHDRLINLNLLGYAKNNCELINVGKASNNHTMPQVEINNLLFEKAIEGKFVVRLKGGDPYIYGRGGEEGVFLHEKGIEIQVVPGISSLAAVTCYAGIPITYRGVSNSIHVFTGHEKEDNNLSLDFEVISKLKGTFVFYMGLNNLNLITEGLINGGMKVATPIALISNGTYGNQKSIIGTLKDIDKKAHLAKSPSLIVVGEVINLRESLNWFENKPLFGKNVLITRYKEKNNSLRRKLEDQGAMVYSIDTIDFKPIEDKSELHNVFETLSEFTHLAFNSVVGAEYFIKEFLAYKKDIRLLGNIKISAMGNVTKAKIEEFYLKISAVYDGSSSIGYLDLLKKDLTSVDKVLIVTSNISEKEKYDELKSYCREVKVLETYNTIQVEIEKEELSKIENSEIITFHSPSAVKSFFNFLNKNNFEIDLNKKIFVTIGKTTEEELARNGAKNIVVANLHNDEGVLNSIIRFGTY